MIVYTTDGFSDGNSNFYDVQAEKTIARVYGCGHFLTLSHDEQEWCILNKYGCAIDFAAARDQEDIVEVRPWEVEDPEIVFRHDFGKDYHEMRDWNKDGSRGFYTFHWHREELLIVEMATPR